MRSLRPTCSGGHANVPRSTRTRPRPLRPRDSPAGPTLEHRIMPRDDSRFGLRTQHWVSTLGTARESIIPGKPGIRSRLVRLDFWIDNLDADRLEVYWGPAATILLSGDDQALFLLPFNSFNQPNRHVLNWAPGTGPASVAGEALTARRQVGVNTFRWTVWWTEEKL